MKIRFQSYERKPVPVQAVQLTQENIADIAGEFNYILWTSQPYGSLNISDSIWGDATLGDWMVRFTDGSVKFYKDDKFQAMFEKITSEG